MKEALLLRLDGPMMSFGAVTAGNSVCTMVDNDAPADVFPGLSWLTGLLANALGLDHREHHKTQALQTRLEFAVRCDRFGGTLRDFQTVDLGQDFLRRGWTTRGIPEGRDGSVSDRTHIRYRNYICDSVYTIALSVRDSADPDAPTLMDLGFALKEPERPLFFGRKCCVPTAPIFLTMQQGETLRGILAAYPAIEPERTTLFPLRARYPVQERALPSDKLIHVADIKDWANGIHVGHRALLEGLLTPPPYMAPLPVSLEGV